MRAREQTATPVRLASARTAGNCPVLSSRGVLPGGTTKQSSPFDELRARAESRGWIATSSSDGTRDDKGKKVHQRPRPGAARKQSLVDVRRPQIKMIPPRRPSGTAWPPTPMQRRQTLLTSAALLAAWFVLPVAAWAQNQPDQVELGFRNPPDPARPRTWWHWTMSNVTKEGITKDLEWMKRVG